MMYNVLRLLVNYDISLEKKKYSCTHFYIGCTLKNRNSETKTV